MLDVLMVLLLVGGAILALPITLVVLMVKTLRRQKEASERTSASFQSLREELQQQGRAIQQVIERMAAGAPASTAEEPPRPEPRPAPPPAPEPPLVPELVVPRESLPLAGAPTTCPVRAPRVPSRFETAAKEILLRVWNWVIVGAEHRPAGVSMEFSVASTWLLRVGVVILVTGIGFFLKYSIDKELVPPIGRVSLSILAGVALLVAGAQMLGRKYHAFGQGLIGGGIATLYFSVYAAFHFYHLIDKFYAGLDVPGAYAAPTAMILMALITVCAGGMAVRLNSMLVAVLGIIGGYATPIMLSTGVVNFAGLFSYVLLLGCGVLGISYKKNWHLLNYLSFLCTYGLFFAAMTAYTPENFWQVMPFLAAFFVLFSTMVFFFNLVNRAKSTLLEAIALVVNAGIFFVESYYLVSSYVEGGAVGYRWVGVVSLALAAFYVAHVYYFLVRRLLDRELMFCFTGLAAFFLAVTVPLILSREWITVSWAVQALVMLWIAGKLQSEFLRHVAYLLYAVVVARFGLVDLPSQYAAGVVRAVDVPFPEYFLHLLERLVIFGVPIASMAGAFRLLQSPGAPTSVALDKANDMAQWVRERWAVRAAVAVVVAMLFLFLHLELHRTFFYVCPPLRLPVLSLLWIALCVWLLYEYLAKPSPLVLGLLAVFVVGLLAKLFVFDLASWRVSDAMRYGGGYSFLEASMRLVDFGAIIAFLGLGFFLLVGDLRAKIAGTLLGSAALALLFVFLSLELNTFLYSYVPGLQAGGISILWALFALAFLLAGIWREIRPLRYVGLALFAVVAWKVFFSDMVRLEPIYRIVAFLFLGVLVLSGSFIYLKYRHTFVTSSDPLEERKP